MYKFSLTMCRFFEIFMILTIIANCIVLALEEHLPNNDENAMTQTLVRCFLNFNGTIIHTN